LAYNLAGPGTPVVETFESYSGSAAPAQWTLGSGPTFQGSGSGSLANGGWWSYGSVSSTERACGFLGNSSFNTTTWTAYWTNALDFTVNDLSLAYRAERWRQGARPSQLSVSYALNGGGYSVLSALAFIAPSVGTDGATNGNDPANSSNLTTTLSGLNLAPGGVFSLRWTYTQGTGSGTRQGLAIDDVSITVGAGAFLGFNSPAITVSETSGTNIVWISGFGISAATAEVAVVSGSATPDADYSFVPVTLAFDEFTTSQAVEIVMLDDAEIEGIETIVLGITNVTGAVISPGGGTMAVTLLDDEYPTASWSPASTNLSEAGSALPVYVELSFTNNATVQTKVSGSAQPGIDYALSSTTLLFVAEGATSNFIEITPLQDGIGESNETIRLSFYDVAGASTGTPFECMITLIDDEPVVSLSPSEFIFTESDTNISLNVSLSSSADATVRVAVAGTAGLNTDFILSETTLVFTAGGSVSTQLQLSAVIDELTEGPERAVLQLVNAEGAFIGTNAASQLGLRDANSISAMSANITSGGARTYEAPGQRIFRALLPDVVAIQEFTPATGTHRAFVDAAFGTGYYFYVESQGSDSIPNGIISRWPIIASGEWSDSVVSDRDFAWATIDIPGPRNLHVVSVHLYASGTAEQRDSQAQAIVNQIQSQFSDDDFIIVGGDFNTQTRSEAAVATLGAVVSDQHKPVDQLGDQDTNANRNKPLDYVLPNITLDTYHRSVNLQGLTFSEGLVFDTRLWTNPPFPALVTDAATVGMQHMPVVKLFTLPSGLLLGPGVVRLEEVGNGDGLFGTNESVLVHFSVRNEGTLDASNVTLEATSINPSLTFVSPYSESFGLMTPGAIVTSVAPAELLIASNAAGGEYQLMLVARDGDYASTNFVNIPIFVDRIAEAVDTTNILWSFSGPWYLQTNSTSDGVDALRSDQPPASSNYWIRTVVTGPGEVRFWWRMVSAPGFGSYAAFQRGNALINYSYSTPWTNLIYNVPSGVHTLRWSHINYSVNPVSSAMMVDRITFTPYTNAFMIVSPLVITSSVMEGSSSPVWTTAVQNVGIGSMSFTARTTTAWIELQPTNGVSAGGSVAVRLYPNLAGFSPGSTNAKIVIEAPDAQSGVQTVTVQLVISTNISPATGSTNLIWSGGGNSSWFAQTNITHDGVSAARSGSIGNNGRTWIEVEAIGPGSFSFWWKVSSEISWDYLNMYLNGTLTTNRITGEINWQQRTFNFTAGVHRVRWEYAKDTSVAEGLDAAWLDEVIMIGVPDRDADGLPDSWESQYFGNATSATTSANSDGDPFTNQEEFFAGTDPSNSNSYFKGVTEWYVATPPTAVLGDSATGRLYDVWITTNLSNDWTPMTTSLPGNGSNLVIIITNDAAELFLRSGVRLP